MLSFDITDRIIRIIKGSESNGKIRISSATTLNLEPEIIVNGHVRDVARLATMINQALREKKMPDKEAIVSISSNMTIFKELHIQRAEKQQDFMKMVRAEMAAALGIDESYSVSYIVVGDSDQTSGAVKVLATACPYEVVDCYKRVFNMLQISLRSVMIGCNCITKVLLADTKTKAKMPLLAVQIDNNFISLNLYENSQLSFSRFASISAEDYDDSEDYVFEAVNENIFRMLQFQKSKTGSDPIENVVFYGDTREYVRLTNELEKMGIRTSIINVPPQIHGYENLEFSSYANAIGAMFKRNKDTERINLLETDTVNNNKIRSDSSYLLILGLCALLSAGLCFGGWFYLTMRNRSYEKKIETIREKQASPLCEQLNEQLKMLAAKITTTKTYTNGATDAYYSYVSQPKPSKEQFAELHNTIVDTIAEVLELEDEDAKKEAITFNKLEYSNGYYAIEVFHLKEKDTPMPTIPTKLANKLRALPDVYDVPYVGYSIEKVQKLGAQQQQAQQQGEDDEEQEVQAAPNQADNKNGKVDDKERVKLTLNIMMKGDSFTMKDIGAQEGEQ